MTPDCFACYPGPNTGAEARALCLKHKQACELADGAPLDQTLALAAPKEGPLEGSSLGWLYNPVFVVDRNHTRRRAYADFAMGGMAVIEDRFGAENHFEFWMYERADMVALLAALPLGNSLTVAVEATSAFPCLAGPLRAVRAWRKRRRLRRQVEEDLAMAQEMWVWERMICARHAALGHWPSSIEELQAVVAFVTPPKPVSAADAAAFVEILKRLAVRRCGAGSAPA